MLVWYIKKPYFPVFYKNLPEIFLVIRILKVHVPIEKHTISYIVDKFSQESII